MSSMVNIYEASNEAVAEMVRDALREHDIPAEIDNIPNPLDGLTAMGQGTAVFVMEDQAERAREVISDWLATEQPEADPTTDEEES